MNGSFTWDNRGIFANSSICAYRLRLLLNKQTDDAFFTVWFWEKFLTYFFATERQK